MKSPKEITFRNVSALLRNKCCTHKEDLLMNKNSFQTVKLEKGEFNIYGIIMDAKNFVRLIMFVRLMGRVILI